MLVELRNIRKSFGKNHVLKDVSLSIKEGEICALLGENGAGKSTLMNILGGIHQPDTGSIYVEGAEVKLTGPEHSINLGISFIHQELNLINDLPIYENMFLERDYKKGFKRVQHQKMIQETKKIFERMHVDLDPRTLVKDLDSSYKQIIEICRAITMNASVIIMDEPTTSLTDSEIERVFTMMRRLRDQQVGIIFISHKLKEVMEVCDSYAVLRDGKLVSEGQVSDVTTKDLARFMVGYDVRTDRLVQQRHRGEEILRAEELTYNTDFFNISFSIHQGEVVGFTGLLGDGRSELFQSIFGANDISTGKLFLYGKEIKIHTTMDAIKNGIAYLPRNRKENAIIKDMDILENSAIASWNMHAKWGIIQNRVHREKLDTLQKQLKIRMTGSSSSILNLSGGNQQKIVLAKWLSTEPRILILDNPTQGVDVGAKEDIYDIILRLADEGIGVIILSSEANEILRLCNRTYVMYHGHLQGVLEGEEMNEQSIMELATGGDAFISKS
ncbi:sugar ABC transporter ATP-binding protein [Oceanobacillus sp. CFH 90083]|uniref:sugar ABC transporter ATP-binding protein n=1 Tax=Oceanobacillus sp. CFH 90083 TaxID=2592336 RepID=UPI00128B4FBB|nr:sugar ABC transporter ATP-binding protein [Oceanobacillus sp. CFH 90083]